MKTFFLPLFVFVLGLSVRAQLITTDPPLPVTNEPVTVTFDATQGSGGLAGYSGDVYAHTGVITEFSATGSDWKYVKTNWGENTPETKLTRIGDDLYSLEITPNIRDYYGVPLTEKILQMAFVFRSDVPVGDSYLEGKTEGGGDIFVDVIEGGLSVTFKRPNQFPVIVGLNESFVTEVNANEADTVALFVDDELVIKDTGNYLIDTITANTFGKFMVSAVAMNDSGSVADTFYYYVHPPVTIEALPDGIRDGINYTDSESVTLCLLAPHKEFAYVIGDFNDWGIDTDYFMKMTPDSLRLWIDIHGLVPGKEYIFQYFVDGKIRIGDPYADKISDPWNDHYITDATYPNLIQYPTGKTSGMATVLQTDQQPYQWQVQNFTPPASTDLTVYELLVRDFTTQHTYNALVDTLDYLKHLGVNAIELMPVNEFDGNISWGYTPNFYFAPDKYYGPKNTLKHFIDECHARGMAVIMDIVLNHSYNSNPMVLLYFDGTHPTPENPWFNVGSNFLNPDLNWGGSDFNHESPYTQAFVDSVNSYWMSEYKFDGFRFDFTKGFSNTYHGNDDYWGNKYDASRIAILERMSQEIWKRNPDAKVIFEHLTDNDEETVLANYGILLWGNISYNFQEAGMGYTNTDFSWISYKNRGWNDPNVVGYMESHDEERIAYKCETFGNFSDNYDVRDTTTTLRRLALNAVFFFTVPGPKMIWQFEEMGYDYTIDYNGRTGLKPVRWDYLSDYRRKYLSDFYGALIKLKEENPAFETGNFTIDAGSSLKRIILIDPTMDVMVLGNFDVVSGNIQPGFPHLGTWYDYFTGQPFEVTDLSSAITLEAGEYRLYTDVQLPPPQIHTGLYETQDEISNLKVYPNPSDQFNIEIKLAEQSNLQLEVYDLTGREIDRIFSGKLNAGIHRFDWTGASAGCTNGIYLLKASTNTWSGVTKLIVR